MQRDSKFAVLQCGAQIGMDRCAGLLQPRINSNQDSGSLLQLPSNADYIFSVEIRIDVEHATILQCQSDLPPFHTMLKVNLKFKLFTLY